jgi:hypothetical protein
MALAVLTLSSATLTAALSRFRTTMSRVVVAATIALSLVLTQVRPLAAALHLESLHADDWAIAGGGSLLVGALPLLYEYAQSMRHRTQSGGRSRTRVLPSRDRASAGES